MRWLVLPAAAGLGACGHAAEHATRQAPHGGPPPVRDREARAPAAPKQRRARSFLIAHVKRGGRVLLRKRPRGKVVTQLGSRTTFGDATALAVLARRGPWLGVSDPQLPNHKLGWFRRSSKSVRLSRTSTWLKIDLRKRVLQLRRGRRVAQDVRVAVGSPQSPTPTGTFSVTDKLPGPRFSAVYGRFILALSGRQPRPPGGWTGGNRLAIHGTNAPERIGKAASAGCVEVAEPALTELVTKVPRGAPVVIRR